MSIYLGNKLISTARIATTDKTGIVKPDGTSIYVTDEGVLSANVSQIKTGSVIFFASIVIPDGYLKCFGNEISRTQYAELFSVIGTTYGAGDGSTTFNIPDLTDKFIQGGTTPVKSVAAGLPNIKGGIPANEEHKYKDGWTPPDGYGAFHRIESNVVLGWSDNNLFDNNFWEFDASRSNRIYGNSSTVQPPAVKMIPLIKY